MPSQIGESVRLRLLGSFELEINGKSVRLPTRKAEGLLAYLVVHRRVQNRERLAALFWGDSTDELARRSLRTALSALRKELGDDFIIADRETIQLNSEFPMWTDVLELEEQSGVMSAINPDIYRGDLLQDFYDEWVLDEREHYRDVFINALHKNVQTLKANGEYQRAILLAEKITSADSVNEQAYQQLIFCQHALGNRSEALKAYEECARQLMDQLGVEPSEDTIALYEQVRKSTTSNTQFVKSNLPIPLTSFIGREHELKTLTEIFATTRLLTLTGVGGCGKTRLSIQLATQLSSQFADGAWWVELASIQDEASLLPVMLKSLGIAESQIDSPEESLIKFLRSRQALLVIDNCEHVISACANLVETVLSQCSDVKILATSREALSIHGEIAWLVPSLSLPPVDQTTDLMKFECPRLFLERATAYRSDLQLNETNAESLLRICRALEGIPLAIELAAARVKTLSLEQLASRLDDKLNLLTTGSRAAQPRQQTLRAAIDWSYELLAEEEKIVLQRLSVFYGTWTLEAAESVCADDDIVQSEILDLITRLLDKSLIVSDDLNGTIRYRMLEIIRQYAMEKLEQRDELQHIRDLHTRFYCAFSQSVENKWYSKEQARLIRDFDVEYPNLRVALAWSLDDPQRIENWECGVKLAIALVPFWNFKAEFNEAQLWLKKVISGVDVLLAESDLRSERRSGLLSFKAKAMYEYGSLSYYLTLHAPRMDLFEGAAQIYQELGDEHGQACANLYIAQAAFIKRQDTIAYDIWKQSLEHFEREGDHWYAAMVYSFLGWFERVQGNNDQADSDFYSAIGLYNELGDEWGMSIMLSHVGIGAFQQNNPVKAREYFERRLEIARKNNFKHSAAYSTFLIGLTYWKEGNGIDLTNCIRETLPYFYQNGNYITLADCIMGLAWVATKAGQLEQAALLLGAAEQANQRYGRKTFFEYDYFHQPVQRELHSQLDEQYQAIIIQGRNANLDDVVKELLVNN